MHIDTQQIRVSSFFRFKSYSSPFKSTAFSRDFPLLLLLPGTQAPVQPGRGCPEEHLAEALLRSGVTEDALFHYIPNSNKLSPACYRRNLEQPDVLVHLTYGLLELLN